MQKAGNTSSRETEARTGGSPGSHPDAALERLEDRVERAVERIESLMAERDKLKSGLAEREDELSSKGKNAKANGVLEVRLQTLGKERDRLLQERGAAALRVEAILKRLEALGLE
jgi:SMC interacting uncharacterized protein involved in chromosome segregation